MPINYLDIEFDKEAILSTLASDDFRNSEAGASYAYLQQKMHMEPEALRLAIQELIEDGAVYNTIDYFHFKIA